MYYFSKEDVVNRIPQLELPIKQIENYCHLNKIENPNGLIDQLIKDGIVVNYFAINPKEITGFPCLKLSNKGLRAQKIT